MEIESVNLEEFREVTSRLASGVCIIASGSGSLRRGLTATAVCSVVAEPPTVLVCVNRSAEAHDVIRATGTFAINILHDGCESLAALFAGRSGIKGAVRFKDEDWDEMVTGSPCLRGAVATIDCQVSDTVELETHALFFGRVVGARFSGEEKPLIYFSRQFRWAAPLGGMSATR